MDIYDHSNYHISIGWYYIDGRKLAFLWMARFLFTFIKRFDGDDSGSMIINQSSSMTINYYPKNQSLITFIPVSIKVYQRLSKGLMATTVVRWRQRSFLDFSSL